MLARLWPFRVGRNSASVPRPDTSNEVAVADWCRPISRHGFEESGVVCPDCGEVAAEPGDWTKIHARTRPDDTVYQEAVPCWNCEAFLMASPDTDIDPIVEGEEYDEEIYHCFVRPPGWTPPQPATLARPPRLHDWVRIANGTLATTAEGKEVPLEMAEGTIQDVDKDRLQVALSGFSGIGNGDVLVWVPKSACAPMVFTHYRVGYEVRIIRGRHRGKVGTIIAQHGAHLTLRHGDNGELIATTQERVVRTSLDQE